MIDSYETSGGREAMLRFGPATGPVVVIALPLFEEANRTRAFAVAICRALAKRGVASVLPDLPGQGESLVRTDEANLSHLRAAFAAVADLLHHEGYRVYSASLRSGAMLASQALCLGHWHLSPVAGREVLRDLVRILRSAGHEVEARLANNPFQINDDDPLVEVAGNLIGPLLLQDLQTDHDEYYATACLGIPNRVVRLDTDRAKAHRHVPGAPLWRRAEPDNDPALAALLADDIADWIATCEG